MNIIELLRQPWPWYASGPLLGLMVPILLLSSNKHFGVSSSFRHICAAALPKARLSYLRYDWKEESWSLAMVVGVVAGAAMAVLILGGNRMPGISDEARRMFASWGISEFSSLQPTEIFSLESLADPRYLIMLLGGGFLVGFGTRYGNGCTSGHAIMGLSLLSFGSLVATVSFFAGGLLVSNYLVPLIMAL
ncbi:MAG: YeeE/YedE family protein [Spirochaetota bacterium]